MIVKTSQYFFIFLGITCLALLSCNRDDTEPQFNGDVVLDSQTAVDRIASKQHVEIYGSLIIDDSVNWETSPITDLAPLSTITKVTGDLIVRNNLELQNLNGLENLEEIGGDVTITSNQRLRQIDALSGVSVYNEPNVMVGGNWQLLSISGLSGLEFVKTLWVLNNSVLLDLDGLHNLVAVSGDMLFLGNWELHNFGEMSSLRYAHNIDLYGDNMEDLSGLSRLDSVSGKLQIKFFEKLTDLSDLSGLSYINSLNLDHNQSLTSLQGMSSLNTIAGELRIDDCPMLTNLQGLASLTACQEIHITNIDNLTSLKGLENLEELERLGLYENPRLSDLSALGKLTRVTDYLIINQSDQLRTLSGLESMAYINRLRLTENALLENIEALQNLESLLDLTINKNPQLTNLDAFKRLNVIFGFNADGNTKLSDFCGIADIDIRGPYKVVDNAFNPTFEDLENGNCRD